MKDLSLDRMAPVEGDRVPFAASTFETGVDRVDRVDRSNSTRLTVDGRSSVLFVRKLMTD